MLDETKKARAVLLTTQVERLLSDVRLARSPSWQAIVASSPEGAGALYFFLSARQLIPRLCSVPLETLLKVVDVEELEDHETETEPEHILAMAIAAESKSLVLCNNDTAVKRVTPFDPSKIAQYLAELVDEQEDGEDEEEEEEEVRVEEVQQQQQQQQQPAEGKKSSGPPVPANGQYFTPEELAEVPPSFLCSH